MAFVNPNADPKGPTGAKKPKKKTPFWLWSALRTDARNSRQRIRNLRQWWREWRKGSSVRVLLAFVLIYALLATLRDPSEFVVENNRHAEEMAFLQDFLKSYCTSGGTILVEKAHGGAELYPRGIVLEGKLLEGFQEAAPGSTFVVHVGAEDANPVNAFYGFPPIYVGKDYFHLERKFDLSPYKFTFLIRKDTDQAGAILLSKVESAY